MMRRPAEVQRRRDQNLFGLGNCLGDVTGPGSVDHQGRMVTMLLCRSDRNHHKIVRLEIVRNFGPSQLVDPYIPLHG